MPKVNRSALVMFSAEQMYNLINDVLSYPQFVPDCADSKLLEQTDDSMTASLMISKGGIKKWFTTQNTLTKNEVVKLELVDGPFTNLVGYWRLEKLTEDACKVSLDLEYEFSSKVMDIAFGKIFNHITNNMVHAFTKRAKEVYS
ncbi:ubiquinone-binding protein [Thalassotalea loyana]|uniref:Ubiquinone-binding protein n=1 Tax=Thalassotalea loyana TaxID=280483 RepID=A0ABQ6H9J2_9GAMM|nr:type II toxin-antitoxin system RatA family toxin [Thalassotalea loyana]GLX84795.1 ubiquinone-binding protein [Thalassotalea loyana]